MKIIKRIVNISAPILLLALLAFRLISNKSEAEAELQKMLEYNEIIPVKVIRATRQKPEYMITETGLFNEAGRIDVVSERQGIVLNVYADIGDYVEAGQTLVTIEKGLLPGQYKLAKLNLENAHADLERFENLVAGDAVTQQQYEGIALNYQNALINFQQLEEQLSNTQITAPVGGFITSRYVESGSFASPGTTLISISQQCELQFVVQMSENDILQIHKGDSADIIPSVLKTSKIKGKVSEIAVNSSLSGRYDVFITLVKPPDSIKPGMSGEAIFCFQSEKKEIIIPRRCLVGSILNSYLFVVNGDSVTKKSVFATSLNDSEVLIHSGVTDGDMIVLAGQINLEQGSWVEVSN